MNHYLLKLWCQHVNVNGQIILTNMRNVLLEKFYIKCGEAIPRPFPKKSKFGVPLGQQSKVI